MIVMACRLTLQIVSRVGDGNLQGLTLEETLSGSLLTREKRCELLLLSALRLKLALLHIFLHIDLAVFGTFRR